MTEEERLSLVQCNACGRILKTRVKRHYRQKAGTEPSWIKDPQKFDELLDHDSICDSPGDLWNFITGIKKNGIWKFEVGNRYNKNDVLHYRPGQSPNWVVESMSKEDIRHFNWKPTAHLTWMEIIALIELLDTDQAKRFLAQSFASSESITWSLRSDLAERMKNQGSLGRVMKLPVVGGSTS